MVIDPRRSETAEIADRHHFIRPGSDAALLLALLHVLFDEGLVRTDGLQSRARNLAAAAAAAGALHAGIRGGRHRHRGRARSARWRANSPPRPSAACHGRMGVSTQRFGTLCQWAIQLLMLLTGNLDRPGGALPTHPAVMGAGPDDNPKGAFARRASRVSGYPEFGGEFPVAALAEEMLTPGAGQIRALVTVAGNPVLSVPNGQLTDRALAGLDFMLSVDIYLNETTRHAQLILPPTSALEHDHYDLAFHKFAVRNTARYNAPVLPKPAGALHDWEIFAGLAAAHARLTGEPAPPVVPPAAMLDFLLQAGPYGTHSAFTPPLSLATLQAHPHGIDLGPLRPSLAERLCTADRMIDCLPGAIPGEIERLAAELAVPAAADALLLIGRRHIRSNNSWMHNSHRLVKGPRRDQLLMHPQDLAARGLHDGQRVTVSSRTGSVGVEVAGDADDHAGHGVAAARLGPRPRRREARHRRAARRRQRQRPHRRALRRSRLRQCRAEWRAGHGVRRGRLIRRCRARLPGPPACRYHSALRRHPPFRHPQQGNFATMSSPQQQTTARAWR